MNPASLAGRSRALVTLGTFNSRALVTSTMSFRMRRDLLRVAGYALRVACYKCQDAG